MTFLVLVAAFLAPPASAEKPLPGLFSLDDYPEEALNRGEQGPVTVELSISPGGRVTACKVLVSAGWSLDRATCRAIVKRARFTPATDAQGHSIADTYTQTIVWRIPGVRPVRPKPNSTRM